MSASPRYGTVAVVGAGTMGAGIAQVCAAAGSEVRLTDATQEFLDRGLSGITAFLDKGVARGKTSAEDREATLSRLRGELDLAAAVDGAELVIEAVPEDLALKVELFGRVAAACPADAVLATNTSSLAVGRIFADLAAPERCLGMHFFNPPPLMPLLEIVKTDSTDGEVLAAAVAYARELGKEPIVVKDSPGFASSRLGVALGLEAIRMVEEDVAAPEDIDKAMELGYRHPMGPLKLTDLVGLDVRMAIADYLRGALDNPAFEVPALMREMVKDGRLGKKAGRGFYDWS